ncbi:hypothetical protein AN641_04505 [Candidatus Epulonipiscioides gigas]|nr:hypothetical protein AN641_04505 [Epulopiscium sp. SCG-C07WGA-EpuloA2]
MSNKKSKAIDYNAIFNFLMIICIIYFATVFIDFFLIFSNIISVSLSFISAGFLALYFFLKKDLCLILSFVCSALCIAITYYIANFSA